MIQCFYCCWEFVLKGSSEYGFDMDTREEVDKKLKELGYILED